MTGRVIAIAADKFGCCNTCLNRDDAWMCDDCHNAAGYEFDPSTIEIEETGLLHIPDRRFSL